MTQGRAVIIGAGIMGQAHALTALEAGWSVTLLERDSRPLGASVRNFGTLLPLGCRFGPEREQALFGVRRWLEIASEAKFPVEPAGSLGLAYREEAWAVLQEFTRLAPADAGLELLTPAEAHRRFPAVKPGGLRGALLSKAEAVVHSPSVLPALARFIQHRGGEIRFGAPVVKVQADAVETADGQTVGFDQLVVAAGEEMRMFFPSAMAAAGLTRCRLQMMRTVVQPAKFRLGAILLSDLTLGHYPVFSGCPSWEALRARLDAELPEHRRRGIHVLAVQHPDGSLVLGDSHEYGDDFPPESHPEVDELILGEFGRFVQIPDPRVAARWQGIYLKSLAGQTQVVLRPRPNVTLVTAMGGLGMTLGWGLARETVGAWTRPGREGPL